MVACEAMGATWAKRGTLSGLNLIRELRENNWVWLYHFVMGPYGVERMPRAADRGGPERDQRAGLRDRAEGRGDSVHAFSMSLSNGTARSHTPRQLRTADAY